MRSKSCCGGATCGGAADVGPPCIRLAARLLGASFLLKEAGFWGVIGVNGVGVGAGLSASEDGVAAAGPVVEVFFGRYSQMSVTSILSRGAPVTLPSAVPSPFCPWGSLPWTDWE